MPESKSAFRPLAWLQCPKCNENGNPSAVVQFEVGQETIDTLRCRECEYEDKPGAFDDVTIDE